MSAPGLRLSLSLALADSGFSTGAERNEVTLVITHQLKTNPFI